MVVHTFEYRDDGAVVVTFDADPTAFAASTAAELYLEDRGFSVGRRQAHEPRGILFGLYDIQKWRNLNSIERKALHGQMTGDGRQARSAASCLLTHLATPARRSSPQRSGVRSMRRCRSDAAA